MERIRDHRIATITARGTQVMETFQVAAFALPVANGEIDKGQLGDVAEIGDGENGLKH